MKIYILEKYSPEDDYDEDRLVDRMSVLNVFSTSRFFNGKLWERRSFLVRDGGAIVRTASKSGLWVIPFFQGIFERVGVVILILGAGEILITIGIIRFSEPDPTFPISRKTEPHTQRSKDYSHGKEPRAFWASCISYRATRVANDVGK